jgi:photosystem II stability/assembly factor-like uncharacterized protein
MEWRSIGPADRGGRVNDIAVAGAGTVMYVAGTGGLFKTVNGGSTWESLFDAQPITAINTVAVAPSDPNTVWVGTGDPVSITHSIPTPGRGVFRSADGGAHWSPGGLRDSEYIGRIVIHPTDPELVFVGVVGPLTRPDRTRGVYRTPDGGRTWRQVLFVNEWTGIVDIAIDPVNPAIIYAAAQQRAQSSVALADYGPASGLYKSTDGGNTWHKLTEGLPTELLGRCGLSISPHTPNVVYALVDQVQAQQRRSSVVAVYRSDDRGEHWRRGGELEFFGRGTYFGRIQADPANADRVYVGASQLTVSTDGGQTFQRVLPLEKRPIFASTTDVHAIWIDPARPDHLVIGHDFGISMSWDAGSAWENIENLPLTQVSQLDADQRDVFYNIYASVRDNSTFGGPSRTQYLNGITKADWFQTHGQEDAYVAADRWDPNTVFATLGTVARYDVSTDRLSVIGPVREVGSPYLPTGPIVLSAHHRGTIYTGADRVFKTTDGGNHWRPLGATLVPQEDSVRIMGATVPSLSYWQRITTIAEAPDDPRVLYAGTGRGALHLSRDGGDTWRRLHIARRVPQRLSVQAILASRVGGGAAYVVFNGSAEGDYHPYLLRTVDYGVHWTSLAETLPGDAAIWALVEHPRNPSLLFVGTSLGVFVSFDRGARWTPFRNNMPAVPVRALTLQRKANDLIAGTWGRGIWVMDDIGPLEHWRPERDDTEAYIFPVRPTPGYPERAPRFWSPYAGPNPPYGALVSYYLPPGFAIRWKARLEVVDAIGRLMRALPVDSAPGLRRSVWDLRERASTGADTSASGPLVCPGAYQVRLTIIVEGGSGADRSTVSAAPLEVLPDSLGRGTASECETVYAWQVSAAHFDAQVNGSLALADTLTLRLAKVRASLAKGEKARRLPERADSVASALAAILQTLRGGFPRTASRVSMALIASEAQYHNRMPRILTADRQAQMRSLQAKADTLCYDLQALSRTIGELESP